MESLKELNKICQKPQYREKGNLMVRYFLRDAALPMTWLLLHTPVTANQVTLAALVIGALAGFFLGLPGTGAFVAGALLLQFWYYLDHVDGQIARYRGTAGLTGRFFDFLMHHLIHAMVPFALGFFVFHRTGASFFLLWGFGASLAIFSFNLVHDIKYKTFFEKLMSLSNPGLKTGTENRTEAAAEAPAGTAVRKSWLHRGFSWLHKLCEIHILMNVLTGAALVQALFGTGDWRFLLGLFYGTAMPLIAIVKITYLIQRREIDDEFERTCRAS